MSISELLIEIIALQRGTRNPNLSVTEAIVIILKEIDNINLKINTILTYHPEIMNDPNIKNITKGPDLNLEEF